MNEANTLWLSGFTVDGYKVSLTVNIDPADLSTSIADVLTAIRSAGILPREQGAEPGEDVHTLDVVVRRAKANDDGSETPLIDLYIREFDYRLVGIYLNTDEDVSAFEQAAGVAVNDIPLYDGNAPLNRTDPKFTRKAVDAAFHPQFSIRKNPKWDDNKSPTENKVPKHLFTRWLSTGSRSEAILADITNGRGESIKDAVNRSQATGTPDSPFGSLRSPEKNAESGSSYICTVVETGTTSKGGPMYQFQGAEVTATAFSLTEIGADKLYTPEQLDTLRMPGKHTLKPIMVQYATKGKYANVIRIERVEEMP